MARPQAVQLKQSSSSRCSSSGAGLAGEGALGVELREGGEEGAEEAHLVRVRVGVGVRVRVRVRVRTEAGLG